MTTHAKTVRYGYQDYIYRDLGPFYSLYINYRKVDFAVLPVQVDGWLLVPLRPVVEGLGGAVVWNEQNETVTAHLGGRTVAFKMNESVCTVNGNTVPIGIKTVTIDGVTVVPVFILYEIFNIDINVDTSNYSLYINNSGYTGDMIGIQSLKYMNYDSYFNLNIKMDDSYECEIFKVAAEGALPNRIAIRIHGPEKKEGQEVVSLSSKTVKQLRYTRYDKNAVGIALDLIGDPVYESVKSTNTIDINIGRKPVGKSPDQEVKAPSQGSDSATGNVTESGNSENKNTENIERKEMTYNKSNTYSSILFLKGISLESGKYSVTQSVSGLRYVLEFQKGSGVVQDGFLNLKDGIVNTISSFYNRLTESTRLVIETPQNCEFQIVPVTTGESGTQIIINAPRIQGNWYNPNKKNIIVNNNITYHSVGDRTALLLNGIQLTQGTKILTKYYTEKISNGGKTLQIEFKSAYGTLNSGTIPIFDGVIEDIVLNNNRLTGKNTIVINMSQPLAYNIVYRSDVKNTAITFLMPAASLDNLVVIDAGHGGCEPGAIYNGVYEKNLNLDIALQVQRVLEGNGINTYMTREDDSFLGLYERTNIANTLNAKVFVSIHNNAITNNSRVNGTMTFYHSASNQGRILSEMLLNSLVGRLKTTNLGSRIQNDYIVLVGTKMPATLVEVAFMSGDIDFTLLTTSEFRDRAAEAIALGIMQYLGK